MGLYKSTKIDGIGILIPVPYITLLENIIFRVRALNFPFHPFAAHFSAHIAVDAVDAPFLSGFSLTALAARSFYRGSLESQTRDIRVHYYYLYCKRCSHFSSPSGTARHTLCHMACLLKKMQTKIKVVLQVLVIVLMLRNPGLLFVNAASYNYQDQDVVMLLPEEREEAASMMTVLKPFDVGLWCTIAGSLIYAVFVTWLLEQRKRSEQRSDLSSTEVFAHISSRAINMSLSSFNIQNRLARIVISIWLLVLSILTISYITNYSVMLNVQKVNVNEIIASDGAIGYLKHHFSPSYQDWSENLKAYTTEEECAKALSQGPNRGGVGVILMDRLDALHFISRRPGYTYYDIPPEADTPRSLVVLDFLVWFIITGTVSTVGLIIFISEIVCTWMRPPTAQSAGSGRVPPVTDPLEMVSQSDSPEASLVRRRAPTTEMRQENRAATSSPFAEGNASPENDDEDHEKVL